MSNKDGEKLRKEPKKKVKIYNTKRKHDPESKIIKNLQAAYDTIDVSKVKSFSDLPLSQRTQRGLKENEFVEPTDIQRQSIALALRGLDILGAAKTGSGKTLAFLIPILEILYCKQWTRLDAVGALVITPTRELAYQIYETLRKIGRYHDLSAGLIIGGKDLHFEKKRMHQCNIVICTPGRLLQHMDENPLFDCVNMQVLVLDEADRCLDMGFEQTMNSIIENLPAERQTLLFSATQTKSVKDLARLSLHDPMYVSVHEHAAHKTPEGLQQSYVVCNLEDKMSMLWSFIRNHLKQKILVFFSSCKQVKYANEMFCRLKPGVSLLALYGTLHQLKRMAIYESFCKKQHAVLFATDIAARGLDFPAVNWVVQMDCPEDVNSYIHRAGRTARFQRGGESLLVLLPSETNMVEQLEQHKIPINVIKINPNKLQSPHRKMEALLARDVALKETAQRAFVAYVKSVFLMKDKSIFDVHLLNTDAYAKSLGLAIPPRIRFLQKMNKAKEVQRARKLSKKKEAVVEDDNEQDLLANKLLQKQKDRDSGEDSDAENESADNTSDDEPDDDKLKQYNASDSRDPNDKFFGNDDSDSDEDILKVKRRDIQIDDDDNLATDDIEEDVIENTENRNSSAKKKALTKAAIAKKLLKKKIVPNKKTTFDEEGEEIINPTKSKMSEIAREYENEERSGIDIDKAREVLREEDRFDKQRFREKVKAKHREEKQKLKDGKKKLKEEFEEEKAENESGEEDAAESSDEYEPDLSWLPDPDKVYGEREDDGAADSDDDSDAARSLEDSDDEEEVERVPKRKSVAIEETIDKKSSKRSKLLEKNVGLSLVEDEELALQLLKNR